MSLVITGSVSEVSGRLRVSLWEATRSPLASVPGLASRCRWEALARVIALWGIAPALFVCLFTCLLWSASSSVRPSLCVTFLPRRSLGPVPSVPFARLQTDTVAFFFFFF